MTCLMVHFSHSLIAPERSAEVFAKWNALARELPAKTSVERREARVLGKVLHHGKLRSSGIAISDDGTQMLAIVGSCWLEPDALSLATPAQVLEYILKMKGLGAAYALHGNFCYVLIDLRANRLTAECGGLGVVSLYYLRSESGLTICTDLKFFAPFHLPVLNRQAVAEYLTFGHLSSDQTLLQNVMRLFPLSRLHFGEGQMEIERFPLPKFGRDQRLTTDALDALDRQFEAAINRYSCDLDRMGASLSGGLDSRTTLLAAKQLGIELDPWTAGEPGSLECEVAKRVCEKESLSLRIHKNDGGRLAEWFRTAVWFTESRCPPGHMHFFDAAFAGVVTPVGQLHGLVGDVVVGGDYDSVLDVPADASELHKFCGDHIQPMIYWPAGSWERLGLSSWVDKEQTRDRVVESVMERSQHKDPYSSYLWSRYQHRGVGFIVPALSGQILPWADLITPFIDPAFFATCASIGKAEILDRRAQLTWSARRYPSIVSVPRVKDGVLLPLSKDDPGDYDGKIKNFRRLMKFRYYISRLTGGRINLPQRESYPFYALWFRKSERVRNFFEEILLSKASLERGLWSREGVEHLLRDLRIGRNVWDALSTLLMIETFASIFVDDGGVGPEA